MWEPRFSHSVHFIHVLFSVFQRRDPVHLMKQLTVSQL